MSKLIMPVIAGLLGVLSLNAQEVDLLQYIADKSSINMGGSNVYSYNNDTCVISVAQVIVGTKSEANCKTVGAAKAKKEMLAFVNGSEITSYTELVTHENTIIDCTGERQVESVQTFSEVIREEVMGHINGIKHLGGWYSDDRSVYYYAIYKII